MGRSSKSDKAGASRNGKRNEGTSPTARSLAIARRGINTATEFKGAMSALMSDVIEGRIAPQVVNAACNAGGKLLKVVELEHRFTPKPPAQARNKDGALMLTQ
jgi:hypothetical protein